MLLKNTILLVWLLLVVSVCGISTFNQVQTQQVAQLQSPDKPIALNVSLSASGEIQYSVQKSE